MRTKPYLCYFAQVKLNQVAQYCKSSLQLSVLAIMRLALYQRS